MQTKQTEKVPLFGRDMQNTQKATRITSVNHNTGNKIKFYHLKLP